MKMPVCNPVDIFKSNWQKAKSNRDANATYCFLATTSEDKQASLRTLVLRMVTDDAFRIFINETSPKWRDMNLLPNCELLVFWPSLMQQYRIRGQLNPLSAQEMALHWQHKPYESKLLDHYYQTDSTQSSPIATRSQFLEGMEQLKQKYPSEQDIDYADNAIGVDIVATSIEVWLGSPKDGLHERTLYRLTNGRWVNEVLVP
ncbi:MAG: pyridoxamine 5'-phosphate oxidase family protein [Pseudomonadales bacterium]|nr:pyridoxamine 5'-phosphate oxidase family protein [Pseudomonadales bacterium]